MMPIRLPLAPLSALLAPDPHDVSTRVENTIIVSAPSIFFFKTVSIFIPFFCIFLLLCTAFLAARLRLLSSLFFYTIIKSLSLVFVKLSSFFFSLVHDIAGVFPFSVYLYVFLLGFVHDIPGSFLVSRVPTCVFPQFCTRHYRLLPRFSCTCQSFFVLPPRSSYIYAKRAAYQSALFLSRSVYLATTLVPLCLLISLLPPFLIVSLTNTFMMLLYPVLPSLLNLGSRDSNSFPS